MTLGSSVGVIDCGAVTFTCLGVGCEREQSLQRTSPSAATCPKHIAHQRKLIAVGRVL